MTNLKLFLILFVWVFLNNCSLGAKEEEIPEEDRVFTSQVLKKIDGIKGVYRGTLDFDFSFLSKPKDWLSIVPLAGGLSNTQREVQISINHSGNDAEKQIIIVVEVVKTLGFLKNEDKEVEFFCTLFDDLSYELPELNRGAFKGSIQGKGKILDAGYVSALEISDLKTKHINCDGGGSGSFCMYIGKEPVKEKSKVVQDVVEQENISVESFKYLKEQRCQF